MSEEDKVDLKHIHEKLRENENLKVVMTGNNTPANKQYKVNKEVDKLLLDFVQTKLDLYKKLTQPEVNALIKSKWFEALQVEMGRAQQVEGKGDSA